MREIIVFGRECSAHMHGVEKLLSVKDQLAEMIDNGHELLPPMTALIDEDEVMIEGERLSPVSSTREGQQNLLLDTPKDYTRFDSHIDALVETTNGTYSEWYRTLIISSPEDMKKDDDDHPSYFYDIETGLMQPLREYLNEAKTKGMHAYTRVQIAAIGTYKIY